MWLPEDACEGRGPEVIPMAPNYQYSLDRLLAHPNFKALTRVWHWDASNNERSGEAFVVTYRGRHAWTETTQAHRNPRNAAREALSALGKLGGVELCLPPE